MSSPANSLIHPQNLSRFMALLLIWSFTPLAVVLSVQAVSPLWAFCLRFLCAAPLAHLLLKVRRQSLPTSLDALKSYAAGALGIYVAMMLTYFAAVSLPSAIISMIFGLSPLVSGVIGLVVYGRQLQRVQWLGVGLGVFGLAVSLGVLSGMPRFSASASVLVVGAMLLSVVSLYLVNHVQTEAHLRMPTRLRRPRFINTMALVRLNIGLDAVLDHAVIKSANQRVKKNVAGMWRSASGSIKDMVGIDKLSIDRASAQHQPSPARATQLTPLMQTVGALWVSFFGALLLLPFIWQSAPSTLPSLSGLVAIGFLVVFASVLAFVFLYELNQRISPTAVSLVTILTPILATLWGALMNHEPVGRAVVVGLGLIVFGLSLFVWGGQKASA